MRARVLMGLVAGTLAAAPAAWAADAANPYGNVNHSVDAGNNTGDSQVDQLNQQELNRVAPGDGQGGGPGDNGSGGRRDNGGPPGQGAGGHGRGYAYGAAPPYPPPYYYAPRYAYPYPAPVVVARPWWGWRRPWWGPRVGFYYP